MGFLNNDRPSQWQERIKHNRENSQLWQSQQADRRRRNTPDDILYPGLFDVDEPEEEVPETHETEEEPLHKCASCSTMIPVRYRECAGCSYETKLHYL